MVWVELYRRTSVALPWLCMDKFYTHMLCLGKGTDQERYDVVEAEFTFPFSADLAVMGMLAWGNYQAHVYHAELVEGDSWVELNQDILAAQNGEKTVWFMRGPSGVGKTTFIQTVLGPLEPLILSMDDYHYVGDNYDFRLNQIGASVDYTQRALAGVLECDDISQIVMDKTCSRYWEYGLELAMAVNAGYKPVIIQLGSPASWDVRQLWTRNRHNVDEYVIRNMVNRWQPDEQHYIPMDSWPEVTHENR
jgi:hypothetical protein